MLLISLKKEVYMKGDTETYGHRDKNCHIL